MKLIMCALSLSLALVACSKNQGTAEKKNIDGMYFSNEYKGYTSVSIENGSEIEEAVVEGDIYSLDVIKDGIRKSYNIDPQDGTYWTQEYSVEVRGGIGNAVYKASSCAEFSPEEQQSLGTNIKARVEVTGTGMKVDDSFWLKISKEDADKILAKLDKEFELLNTRESCKKEPGLMDSVIDEETVRSKFKEFLDQ